MRNAVQRHTRCVNMQIPRVARSPAKYRGEMWIIACRHRHRKRDGRVSKFRCKIRDTRLIKSLDPVGFCMSHDDFKNLIKKLFRVETYFSTCVTTCIFISHIFFKKGGTESINTIIIILVHSESSSTFDLNILFNVYFDIPKLIFIDSITPISFAEKSFSETKSNILCVFLLLRNVKQDFNFHAYYTHADSSGYTCIRKLKSKVRLIF